MQGGGNGWPLTYPLRFFHTKITLQLLLNIFNFLWQKQTEINDVEKMYACRLKKTPPMLGKHKINNFVSQCFFFLLHIFLVHRKRKNNVVHMVGKRENLLWHFHTNFYTLTYIQTSKHIYR